MVLMEGFLVEVFLWEVSRVLLIVVLGRDFLLRSGRSLLKW